MLRNEKIMPESTDWLLVNVAPDWASIAILRGPQLIFFRSRTSEGEGTLADLIHQTAMYYEDRLSGTGFAKVLLSGASTIGLQPGDVESLRKSLADRLGTTVGAVDPTAAAALTFDIPVSLAIFSTIPCLFIIASAHVASAGSGDRDQRSIVNVEGLYAAISGVSRQEETRKSRYAARLSDCAMRSSVVRSR